MCALLIIRNLLPHVAFDGWSVIHTHLPQCTCYSYYSFLSSTFSLLSLSLSLSLSLFSSLPAALFIFRVFASPLQELHFLSLTLSVTSNEHKSPLNEASLACLWVSVCLYMMEFAMASSLLHHQSFSVTTFPLLHPPPPPSASLLQPWTVFLPFLISVLHPPLTSGKRITCSLLTCCLTSHTLCHTSDTLPVTRQFKLTGRLDTFFFPPSMRKARAPTPRHEKVSAPSASDCEW